MFDALQNANNIVGHKLFNTFGFNKKYWLEHFKPRSLSTKQSHVNCVHTLSLARRRIMFLA